MPLDIKAVSTSANEHSYGNSLTREQHCLETVLHMNSRQPSLLCYHPLHVLNNNMQCVFKLVSPQIVTHLKEPLYLL